MQPVLNVEDIKRVEVELTRVGVSVSELMHRAGYAAAQEVLEQAVRGGADALLVQDWGLAALCRRVAPELPLHASTQMGVHDLDGVRQAAALGCTRAVLARETSREELRLIAGESPILLETLVNLPVSFHMNW